MMIARNVLFRLCLCVMVSGASLSAQSTATTKPSSLSGGAVAGQLSSGVLGTAVGFVAGGLTTRWFARKLGAENDAASHAAYIGAYAGAALLTAVGPAAIGSRGNAHGSYPAAVGGAVAGGAVSALILKLGRKGKLGERGPAAILAGIAIVALPSIGATLAYNATR